MLTASTILGILIVCIGILILDRCGKILSTVRWIEQRFLCISPSTGHMWRLDLAHEVLSIKEKLAPFFFMPFADIAANLRRMNEMTKEDFDRTLNSYERLEREEMEIFAASKPPDGQAFMPSDNLKRALMAWSKEKQRNNIISEWNDLFGQTYTALLSGKMTLEEAEEKLDVICSSYLLIENDLMVDPKIIDIYTSWASRWNSESWKKRLDHLKDLQAYEEEHRRN